jgi:hypothetical protein
MEAENYGGLQAFSASFSKSRLDFAKDFQRKLWPFCAISTGYKGPKPFSATLHLCRSRGS